ncbi:MAG: Ig-like domain repeat protein [Roseinatronobacter sp.]
MFRAILSRMVRPGLSAGARAASAVMVVLLISTVAASAQGLFRPLDGAQPQSPAQMTTPFPATQRFRDVLLDTAYLSARIAPVSNDQAPDRMQRLPSQQTIKVELFPGLVLELQPSSISEAYGGGYVWTGEAPGAPNGSANLVIRNGQITGHVTVMSPQPMNYRIDPVAPGGIHRITELDGSAFPREGHIHDHDDHGGDEHDHAHDHHHDHELETGHAHGDADLAPPQSTGVATIDVLVAYTPAAAASVADPVAQANLAVSLSNTGFQNSNVAIQFRLVGTTPVPGYTERSGGQGYQDMLFELTGGWAVSGRPDLDAAAFADVRAMRETTGADLVALLVDNLAYCGIAWRPNMPSASTSDTGYSLTSMACTSNHTFAHELGHNMGLHHDRYVSATAPSSAYNYGFVSLPGQFLTIMAYRDLCSANSISCTRINYFSNPSVNFNGRATGIPAGTEGAADAARWLNEVRHIIAAYRATGGRQASSTALAAPATGALGEPLTLTATVSVASGTPTGTVRFLRDATQIGQANLGADRTAALTTSGLPVGMHQITAVYSGDDSYFSSTSDPVTVTITTPPGPINDLFADRTTIPGPGTYAGSTVGATSEPGQPIISGGNSTNAIWWRYTPPANGLLTIDLCDSDYDTTLAVFTGSAVNALSLVASDDIACNLRARVEFSATMGTEYQIGVGGWNNATGNVVLNLAFVPDLIATSTALTAPSAGLVGEALTFRATVTAATGTPGGRVSFRRNGTEFAAANLNAQGIATATRDTLPEGSHQITAHYEGNAAYAGSVSPSQSLVISAASFATQTVIEGPSRGTLGEVLNFSATVTSDGGIPTGRVSFRRDGSEFANANLNAQGIASVSSDGLPEGTHQITARFLRSGSFTASNSSPIQLVISNDTTQIAQIAVGGEHACALTFGGEVYCWGSNARGQLGDGNRDDRFRARPVQGLRQAVTQISMGLNHSCALLANARVFCWGDNRAGQLGDSAAGAFSTVPVAVARAGGSTSIATPGNSSCLLDGNRAMQCWGNNGHGQLGIASTDHQDTPRRVRRLEGNMLAMATGGVGQHNCALNEIGRAFCWGRNHFGQVGDGTLSSRSVPTRVDLRTGRDWQEIAIGGLHGCARNAAGRSFCWGANQSGELGDGTTDSSLTAVAVSGLGQGTQALAVGQDFSCALNSVGRAFCWGSNQSGRLGTGAAQRRNETSPARVRGLGTGNQQISAGTASACVLDASGTVLCWGSNSAGQLGNPADGFSSVPVRVRGLP